MGYGGYDTSVGKAKVAAARSAPGAGFAYSHSTTSAPRSTWTAHADLDPKGVTLRESRDSDEHPESVPVVVLFDVTGSMGHHPRILQEKLPELFGLILRKGYLEHPQIMFGAIGDGYSDRVPLQISQWESDNKMDDHLANLLLEGGGGGGNHESYELAAYFLARHTATDAWEKRGKKGYVFFIGDERVYARVNREQVANIIGDTLQEDIDTVDIFNELKSRFDVYHIFVGQASYAENQVLSESAGDGNALGWRPLVSQNSLLLDDSTAICETIALAIGVAEGVVDVDGGVDHLREAGVEENIVLSASKAVATVPSAAGAAVATVSGGALPAAKTDAGGSTRL